MGATGGYPANDVNCTRNSTAGSENIVARLSADALQRYEIRCENPYSAIASVGEIIK